MLLLRPILTTASAAAAAACAADAAAAAAAAVVVEAVAVVWPTKEQCQLCAPMPNGNNMARLGHV